MKTILFMVLSLVFTSSLTQARDWHSADGARTMQGSFVRLAQDQLQLRMNDGKPLAIGLALLSAEDQAFARAAQSVLDEAIKLGAKSFEIGQPMTKGALCRMAMKLSSGTVLFTGDQFYLIGEPQPLTTGTRLKDQPLYFAGMRNLHAAQGGTVTPVKAYSRSLEAAVAAALEIAAGKASADIREPVLESIEATGIGIALNDDGLLLVDAALVDKASSIDVDVGKNHAPGIVVASDPKLGIAIISCKGSFQAARLAPKKPAFVGMPVYVYGIGLEKRGLGGVSISKGSITKLASKEEGEASFEHNAVIGPDVVGGIVVTEKGDAVGLLKARPAVKTQRGAKKSTAVPELADVSLATCVRTDALDAYLRTRPKSPTLKPCISSDLKALTDAMPHFVTIVKVLRQRLVETTPPATSTAPTKAKAKAKAKAPAKPATATTTTPTTTPPDGTATFSLSKTGIRHNAKCRYFNAELPCKESDGTPCKLCGG